MPCPQVRGGGWDPDEQRLLCRELPMLCLGAGHSRAEWARPGATEIWAARTCQTPSSMPFPQATQRGVHYQEVLLQAGEDGQRGPHCQHGPPWLRGRAGAAAAGGHREPVRQGHGPRGSQSAAGQRSLWLEGLEDGEGAGLPRLTGWLLPRKCPTRPSAGSTMCGPLQR